LSAEGDKPAETVDVEGAPDSAPTRDPGRLPKLPIGMRVLAFFVGWGLVLVGVAGLALPGIQGILTLLAGTAVLSVVSETVYRLLRRAFRRWPRGWRRVHGFRNKVHGWLHRTKPDDSPDR
jgi:hypothetical protein